MAIAGPVVATSATGEQLAIGPQGVPGKQGPPGIPGPPGTSSFGQGAVALSSGVLNSNVAVANTSSILFTGCTQGTQLGGLVLTPIPNVGVPFDVEFDGPMSIVDSDASSSVGNQILTGTGGPVQLPPGQKPRARFVRTLVGGVSTYNLQTSGVHSFVHVNILDWSSLVVAGDWTAAIQAAVNFIVAAGGGILYFPPGTYIVSAQITIPRTGTSAVNLHLEGSGKGVTVIVQAAPFNIFSLIYPASTTCLSNFTQRKISFTKSYAVPAWTPNTPYVIGDLVTVPQGASPYVWKCTTGGTSGARPSYGIMASANFADPQITLSGVPTAAYDSVRILIQAPGGSPGSFDIKFSTDNGAP